MKTETTTLKTEAIYSDDGTRRFLLRKIWSEKLPKLAIIMLSPAIPALLAEDGVYIVSGIIDTREQDVLTALDKCGFTVIERHEHRGWICLVCKK